jgi:hypothetical protein
MTGRKGQSRVESLLGAFGSMGGFFGLTMGAKGRGFDRSTMGADLCVRVVI